MKRLISWLLALIPLASLAQSPGTPITSLPPALPLVGTEIIPGAQLGSSGSYTPPAVCAGGYCGVGITLNQVATFTGTGGGGGIGTIGLNGSGIISFGGSPCSASTCTFSAIWTGTSGGVPYFSSTNAVASSALLTNHALVLGGGAGQPPHPLASLGTSTTVYHGASAGDGAFGAVNLTTDVTNVLPPANGGKGMTINSQASTYAFVIGDQDNLVKNSGSGSVTWTIPQHGAGGGQVNWTLGHCITVWEPVGAGTITVAITSDTLIITPTNAAPPRIITPVGFVTLCYVDVGTWVIGGPGAA